MIANGDPTRLSPKMRPGKVGTVDLEAFARAMSALVTSGLITLDGEELEVYTREAADLPPKEFPEGGEQVDLDEEDEAEEEVAPGLDEVPE